MSRLGTALTLPATQSGSERAHCAARPQTSAAGSSLGASISRLIRDHFPFAFCPACAAKKLGVSAFDFRNAAQVLAVQADFAITRRACSGCGSVADLLALKPEAAGGRDREPVLDDASLRVLIGWQMADGRLPRGHMPRLWGGIGIEGTCAACERPIARHDMAMGRLDEGKTKALGFHARCFHLWERERRMED
jgi:hypothetical protein